MMTAAGFIWQRAAMMEFEHCGLSRVIHGECIYMNDASSSNEHFCTHQCCISHIVGNMFKCENSGKVHICDNNCRERLLIDDCRTICRISQNVRPLTDEGRDVQR